MTSPTTKSSPITLSRAAYDAAIASPASLTWKQWGELADLLTAAAARSTGDTASLLTARAGDCRVRAMTAAADAIAPRANCLQVIPVIRETFAVEGPAATAFHSGFVAIADAHDCASHLTSCTGRPHTVSVVPTAPQRRQAIPTVRAEVA